MFENFNTTDITNRRGSTVDGISFQYGDHPNVPEIAHIQLAMKEKPESHSFIKLYVNITTERLMYVKPEMSRTCS